MARKIQITNYLTRVLSDCVHIFSAGLQQQQKKTNHGIFDGTQMHENSTTTVRFDDTKRKKCR